MAYIGNIPAEKFTSVDIQNFTVSATANYTLDRPVANENEIELFINNVRQHPGSGKAYTASGTTLTLSEATAGTDTMYCVYQGKARQTVTPADSSVTNAMLAGSIADAKISAMAASKLTGTVAQANIADQAINEAKLQVSNAPTNGYMLTAQSGNTGGLTWAEAGGGGLTFIKREVLGSNGDFDIDNLFTTNFANYLVVLEDFTATVDSAGLRMRMHDTSGIVTGAKYRYACRYFTEDGGVDSNTGIDQTQFQIATNSEEDATWIGYNATLTFYKPRQNTSTRFSGHGSFIRNDKTDLSASYLAGHIDDEQEMRGLFFYYSSGDIRAGATITSYGFNES